MEKEEEIDTGKLTDRVEQLRELNDCLRQDLQGRISKANNLQTENARLQEVADRNYKWFVQTHDALNVLREDANRALTDGGVRDLHRELEELREKCQRLLSKRKEWTEFGRRCAEAKSAEAERARDLEAVVVQLNEKIERIEKERNDTAAQDQIIIETRDAQLSRIKEQCGLWNRGDLGAMAAVAGITAEMRGYPLPVPGAWDRSRAVKEAELRSALRSAQESVNEWKAYEAAARGAATRIAEHFDAPPVIVRALTAGDYEGAIQTLDKGDDKQEQRT